MHLAVALLLGITAQIVVGVLASVFNVSVLLPAVPVIFVVWATVRRDAAAGLLAALVLGWIAGLQAGGGRGLLLVSLLPVVLFSAWARLSMHFQGVWATAGWVVGSCVLADVVFALLCPLFLPSVSPWGPLLRVTPAVALLTGATAVVIFAVLSGIEPLLDARQERTRLLR